MQNNQYNTLEDIALRKDELKAQLSDLIGNAITAVDAFLLVRKLMNTYGWLFGRRKKKK